MKIFPLDSQLPENLLRFHIDFESQVDHTAAIQAVTLFDSRGQVVEHAFLDLPSGLWDTSGRVLTLMLHPARIKHGLMAQSHLGSALQPFAGCYRLVIDARVVGGASNDVIAEKTFEVMPPIITSMDIERWMVQTPSPGTLKSINIEFDRPVDALAVKSLLAITDAQGQLVPGHFEMLECDLVCRFTPDVAWPSDKVKLHVHSEFEDISGNRVAVAFEVCV
jgi:hypothetical protein